MQYSTAQHSTIQVKYSIVPIEHNYITPQQGVAGGRPMAVVVCGLLCLFLPLPVSPARVWLPAPVGQSLKILSAVCGKTVEPPLI